MLAKRRGIHYSPVLLNSCKENFSLKKKKTLPVQSQQKMAGAAPTAEGFPGTQRQWMPRHTQGGSESLVLQWAAQGEGGTDPPLLRSFQSHTSALRPNLLELPVFIYSRCSSFLMKCFIREHS